MVAGLCGKCWLGLPRLAVCQWPGTLSLLSTSGRAVLTSVQASPELGDTGGFSLVASVCGLVVFCCVYSGALDLAGAFVLGRAWRQMLPCTFPL